MGIGGLGGTPTVSVPAHKANQIIKPRELRKEAWRSGWFASDLAQQIRNHHDFGLQVEQLSQVFGKINTVEPKALIHVYLE